MYPPQFDYYRASSVEEALELLERTDESRVLAGGHSLLPELKARRQSPEALVDVSEIDSLRSIDVGESETVVGALTTYAALVRSDAVWEHAGAFAEATKNVGDIQIRNRGTVGGNLAQADAAGDLPAAVVATDATITVESPVGERSIAAEDFFVGENATALEEGELVTAIQLPHVDGAGGAYVKKTHPASGYAMVGVAAVLGVEDGDVSHARVASNGVTETTCRLRAVEEALLEESLDPESPNSATLEAAAKRTEEDLESASLVSDSHASGEFRAHLLPTYVERALESAIARASESPAAVEGGESE